MKPTNIVEPVKGRKMVLKDGTVRYSCWEMDCSGSKEERAKARSKTFPGIAKANVYAGTYAPPRKDGLQAWRNKSEVTSEAVEAVMGHFITEMEREDKKKLEKAWGVIGNKKLKVTFELVPKQGVVR